MLAEIADKMPTAADTALVAVAIALIALCFGRLHGLLMLAPLPLVLTYDWAMIQELREPGFGDTILSELGRCWVIAQFAGWNVPFVVVITLATVLRRRGRRRLIANSAADPVRG